MTTDIASAPPCCRPDDKAWRGVRVLITGGLGFIGSNLARRLIDLGADVAAIDSLVPEYGGNPFNLDGYAGRVRINVSDMRDPHSLRYMIRDREVIFNLAGQTSHMDSMSDPMTDLAINGTAQLSLLELCRKENPQARLANGKSNGITRSSINRFNRISIHQLDVSIKSVILKSANYNLLHFCSNFINYRF